MGDFAAFCKDASRTHEKPDFAQGDDHPVVNISFNDAQEFCAWLSKKEGKTYRLPSDHEWSGAVGIAGKEDASAFPKSKGIERAKSKRNEIEGVFPWGDAWPPPVHSGNFDTSLNADAYNHTSPVGTFTPTADGLYDLAGNVWEWCDSIYEHKEHYRVLRGGSWRYRDSMFLLSAFRGRGNTPTRHDTRGFRVVLEVGDDGQALLAATKRRSESDRLVPGKVFAVSGSRLVANLKAGKAQKVVTYGTSLTSGGAWVKQLDAALKARWPKLITVVNSGAGGMWSKWGVENLAARVIGKKPDTLLIEFAINDAYLPYKTSVAEARDNLNNMIDRVLAAKADTEIILMTMNPPIGNHLRARPAIRQYYEMYRQVAKERKLKLVDHALNWKPILAKDRALFDKYVPDGIHPGIEGCEKVITLTLLKALGAPQAASPGKIKVLLVGGRGSHDWHGFHDTIGPVLKRAGDFELKLTPNVDDLNVANLSNYRVVMFYGPGGDFTDKAQEQALHNFVKNGGGLVGVNATDAFKQSDVYWRLMGGRFTTHRGGDFTLRIENNKHPVTASLKDFRIHDETYANQFHPDFKLHSLGRIDRGQEQQSMVWVQNYKKGRVFNTTLGHEDIAWKNPNFQKLVLRGLYWAAGREPKSPFPSGATAHPDTSTWQPLFNADLSNAEFKQGVWTVKDGVITASEDRAIWTKEQHQNFTLDLEFKTAEGTNSGVIIYATDKANWIPNSLEVQIADDDSKKWSSKPRTWQCAAIFGRLAATKSVVKKPGEWNRMTITCEGKRVTVVLNGEKVTEMDMAKWTDAKKNPDGSGIPSWLSRPAAGLATKGFIGLQGKHAGAPIYYRNVKLKTGK